MKTPLVQKITIAAGKTSNPINMDFNFIHIRPENSATFSDELSMKLDGGSFEKVATGFGFGSDETSNQIQFRNDSASPITFTVTLFKGNVFSNNQNFDGSLTVGAVVIDDATPVKVEQQTSIDVLLSTTTMALLNRIADACEQTATNTTP